MTMEVITEPARLLARVPAGLYPDRAVAGSGEFLRITVCDSGVGIPAEALVTIFDRFEQAKTRRAGKTAGTGLGLAFCRKVMEAHHGIIWAESEERRGSSFIALFPLDPEESASRGVAP